MTDIQENGSANFFLPQIKQRIEEKCERDQGNESKRDERICEEKSSKTPHAVVSGGLIPK
jgi:hypothetical protein